MSYRLIITACLVIVSSHGHAALHQVYTPTQVRTIDGDTIEMVDANRLSERVRLLGIDAPESGQDFGNRSRQSLDACLRPALEAGTLTVIAHKKDRYDRLIGKIMAGDQDCNLNQIALGMAWHYKAYQDDQELNDRLHYAQAEQAAQSSRLGLWSMCAVPPWDYRRGDRTCHSLINDSYVAPAPHPNPNNPPTSSSPRRNVPLGDAFGQNCASLRGMTCRQFTSCTQAKAALACGNTRLDGDKDGVPCEAICR